MRTKIFIITILFLLTLFSCGEAMADLTSREAVSGDDYQYLMDLASDTWDCIEYLVEPSTGLPYDISRKEPTYTSVTNIGMYIAGLAAATELGFIERNKAIDRLSQTLDSLEKFPAYNGFTQSWHDVLTLESSQGDPWISILDSGNLAAGYIVARQAFPELSDRISKLLDAMDWSKFYNPDTNQLYGGYNMQTKSLNYNWCLPWLGSDARNAFIVSIGSGRVPAQMWDSLSKKTETKYGLSYYEPGWQGGGLFMQFISSCFIDERWTDMWKSGANFAYAQIFHAELISCPVWGWSSSDSPCAGYLGMNAIKDEIITPHACSLVISIFPQKVITNFKNLELLGAREDFEIEGKSYSFGFRDAINVVSGESTNTYLILDQGMLFLSLANFLTDGKIWELSSQDAIIKNAGKSIRDFQTVSKKDIESYIKTLHAKSQYVRVKSIYTKREYQEGEAFRQNIVFINDDPDVNKTFVIIWKLFDRRSDELLEEGLKEIKVSGRFKEDIDSLILKVGDSRYVLRAIVKDKDGKILSKDSIYFTSVDYIDLAGKWLFKTGDNLEWKNIELDDGGWKEIHVPKRWEDQGYEDYDGYAWYRLYFNIPEELKEKYNRSEVSLQIGGIDDADEIYLNAQLIGSTAFPPDFEEGYWDKERLYTIPSGLLNFDKENILAVRVYDYTREAGIWKAPVRLILSRESTSRQ